MGNNQSDIDFVHEIQKAADRRYGYRNDVVEDVGYLANIHSFPILNGYGCWSAERIKLLYTHKVNPSHYTYPVVMGVIAEQAKAADLNVKQDGVDIDGEDDPIGSVS